MFRQPYSQMKSKLQVSPPPPRLLIVTKNDNGNDDTSVHDYLIIGVHRMCLIISIKLSIYHVKTKEILNTYVQYAYS